MHYADEWDTGAALVARGFGVALVPRLANLPAHHDTRRIPITGDPAPTRHVIAAVRAGSGHQPGITAGLDALRHVARDVGQWLSRGTPLVCATRWYFTAGFSTMPSASWSTMPRWISCHGVW